ncbi:MAG: DAK2 domain-containing protein [Chloroflexota bacterium]|nr:MAG: DAK2 domain-containing protein [Chloroflexota bacterium]
MADKMTISAGQVTAAMERVAKALQSESDYLTTLDQAMGDGDTGITTTKVGAALDQYLVDADTADLGKLLMTSGMKINSAAPSTMGTLLATSLMRAGKEAKGKQELDGETLAIMLSAADQGIQDRGKAKPGDKTIVDALHPAAQVFGEAVSQGETLRQAGEKMLAAAEEGLAAVTPLQSRVGRASWVGERTKNKVDPGCATLIVIFKAILNE